MHMTERRTALIVVSIASFLTPFMASSVNVALPTIAREFSLDAVMLGWVATSYMLASAVTLLPAGRLGDMFGRKRVFLVGTAVFSLASLLIALAPSGPFLIAARVLQGAGAAMNFATNLAILTSAYPANEKGRVLGINVAAVYIGQSVGPTVGGLLTQYFGWRSIFAVVVPLTLLNLVLALTKLKSDWAEARGEAFDLRGVLTYGVSLVMLIMGLSSLPAWSGLGLMVLGVAGFVFFFVWEDRAPSPALNLSMFRESTVFTYSCIAALINYLANAATAFLLSLYLQQVKGLSPQAAGLVLIAQPIVQATFSPLTGRMSDSVEPRLLASAGMGCAVVGLGLLAALGADTPLAYVVLVLMLMGMGFALFSSPNTNAIMSSVSKRFYGVAGATVSTARVIGQTLSIGIVMLVFAMLIGRVEIGPQNLDALLTSMRVLFAFFAGLCVIGIYFSLARGNMRR